MHCRPLRRGGKRVADPDVVADRLKLRDFMVEHKRSNPWRTKRFLGRHVAGLGRSRKLGFNPTMPSSGARRAEQPALEAALSEGWKRPNGCSCPTTTPTTVTPSWKSRGNRGDEASLFAGDLVRMYLKHADEKGWNHQWLQASEGTVGGFKQAVLRLEGEGVFGWLKFERGVHRVQRVPDTESQGRVHTSAATVAVLPVAREVDVALNLNDVRKDTFRASGAGGQHVNKTESAVRLTHTPTGTVVECQDGRSQHQNYEWALEELRTRLYDAARAEAEAARAAERKSQVSTGDRSAKIRTYNFPQGRVTDHRIGLTVHALQAVMQGQLQEVIEALHVADRAEQLKNL